MEEETGTTTTYLLPGDGQTRTEIPSEETVVTPQSRLMPDEDGTPYYAPT